MENIQRINGFINLDELFKSSKCALIDWEMDENMYEEYKGTNIMNYVKIFSIISFILFIAYVLIICESFKTQDNDLNKNLEN